MSNIFQKEMLKRIGGSSIRNRNGCGLKNSIETAYGKNLMSYLRSVSQNDKGYVKNCVGCGTN